MPKQFETPMKLHCSQTGWRDWRRCCPFETPMKLHCSQTRQKRCDRHTRFETPMKLHCSQTLSRKNSSVNPFETPMKLHCSQTRRRWRMSPCSLRPLWNCTALKLDDCVVKIKHGLRPLWNCTALKQAGKYYWVQSSLRPLWNCTALKLTWSRESVRVVWDPYETALLSNDKLSLQELAGFETPMKLHCSQTGSR